MELVPERQPRRGPSLGERIPEPERQRARRLTQATVSPGQTGTPSETRLVASHPAQVSLRIRRSPPRVARTQLGTPQQPTWAEAKVPLRPPQRLTPVKARATRTSQASCRPVPSWVQAQIRLRPLEIAARRVASARRRRRVWARWVQRVRVWEACLPRQAWGEEPLRRAWVAERRRRDCHHRAGWALPPLEAAVRPQAHLTSPVVSTRVPPLVGLHCCRRLLRRSLLLAPQLGVVLRQGLSRLARLR